MINPIFCIKRVGLMESTISRAIKKGKGEGLSLGFFDVDFEEAAFAHLNEAILRQRRLS